MPNVALSPVPEREDGGCSLGNIDRTRRIGGRPRYPAVCNGSGHVTSRLIRSVAWAQTICADYLSTDRVQRLPQTYAERDQPRPLLVAVFETIALAHGCMNALSCGNSLQPTPAQSCCSVLLPVICRGSQPAFSVDLCVCCCTQYTPFPKALRRSPE